MRSLAKLPRAKARAHCRNLCRTDLYFLLRYGLQRADVEHRWLHERCVEVQENPDGYLDLWAREHYKSTIITYALTIQDILSSHGDDPLPKWNGMEVTVGIFSCTRPIAKGFLRQIKREFEGNLLLKEWFPDILWEHPHKEAPKWSEDDGLVLKRKGNPKESTVEAWGLVDGQPTSKHFFIRVYDDVVTIESVSGPDMIKKVTERWELSQNLGAHGGIERYIGTRYHYNDTYKTIMDRKTAVLRKYPCTRDGKIDGQPVLLTTAALQKKRRDMGSFTFACQMMQDPKADEVQGFKKEWLRYYDGTNNGNGLNIYIIVDPASKKKKSSDYTTMNVIGLGGDKNYYKLDMIRDRLSLTQRCDALFALHRKWNPNKVGYEEYGMQSDIEHIQYVQGLENYRFEITPLGGKLAKEDRIRKLIPVYEQGRMYMMRSLYKPDYEGKTQNLVESFINDEFCAFPVALHDDMLDGEARILDPVLAAKFPDAKQEKRASQAVRAKIDFDPLEM